MRNRMTLKDWGYPAEGIILVDDGGGDFHEAPQEALSAHTCGSCRLFNGDYCTKDWNNGEEDYCIPERDEKDPDFDYCDDIDYVEEWLDSEYGFRSPVRNEYSSDKAFKQACDAISAINRYIEDEAEHEYYVRMYGENYWRDEE